MLSLRFALRDWCVETALLRKPYGAGVGMVVSGDACVAGLVDVAGEFESPQRFICDMLF